MPTRYIALVRQYVVAHKMLAALAIIVIGSGSFYAYRALASSDTTTRYVLGTVERGSIVSTVSASGQVSPSNQVDIKPKVSGDVVSVPVSSGQYVQSGAAIAYLDSSDAQKAVRDAQNSLETAELSLEKLLQPADTLTLTQAENNLAKAIESKTDAEDNLADAYIDGFDAVTDTFLDFPATMTGLYDALYKTNQQLGGSSVNNLDFYSNGVDRYTEDLQGTRFKADVDAKYADAKSAYDKAFATYKSTSRASSPEVVSSVIQETYDAADKTLAAIKSMNNLIQLYKETATTHNTTVPGIVDTQLTTLNSYTSSLTTRANSLSSSLATIKSSKQAIINATRSIDESRASLDKTKEPPDELDLRSAQITVEQRQNSLQDARDTLADYTVRAPFAGTIAKLDVDRGDSVSTGTSLATIVTKQQIAELSLNEVDAAKIEVGQKATLTFDAIEDLSITGEVAAVDIVGTVTQGVVSYTVSIAFDAQDSRVKPGMTANATITIARADDVLVVPASAVKSQGDASFVLVLDDVTEEDVMNKLGIESATPPRRVPVTVGISDDTSVHIVSGLEEGQHIVTKTTTGTSASSATKTSATGSGMPAGGGQGAGAMMRL